MFVADLDRDLPGIALRQQVTTDLGCGLSSQALGGVEAGALQALVVGG